MTRPQPDPDLPDPRRMEPINPWSPKAIWGAIGSGIGTVLTTFLLWLIGAAISNRWDADGVDNAIAAVPSPLAALLAAVVIIGTTLLTAYAKKDPERLPTLGAEQKKRVGLVGVDTRPRRAAKGV